MNEVLNFLKETHVFFVATMDKDQPRVRPFGALTEFEGKLYLITSNKKPVFKQMMENPKIEISAASQTNGWLRLTAKVVLDSRQEAREKMLDDIPMLKKMYSANDGKIEVLYLTEAEAVFSSMSGESKTINF